MRKLAWLWTLLFAAPLFAQTDAIQGYCDRGGTHSLVSGLGATNWQLGNIPGCTVSVYFTGTTNLVTGLKADALGTPLSNPFTATMSTSPNPGYWIFWAPVGVGYDVTMSGGGGVPTCTTQPNCYAIPITKTDLKVGGSGGGGSGVTNVDCDPAMGNLLGCLVSNTGTTPQFHWSLNTQGSNTVYGNFTGSTGPPFFAKYLCTGLFTCNFDSGTNTWTLNVPTSSSLSITSIDPIKVNGANGPVASGTAQISCPTCGASNFTPTIVPPIPGQYVIIYPTASGASGHNATASNTSATLIVGPECSLSQTSNASWTYINALETEAPWVVPANVTAVYAFSVQYISAKSQSVCFAPGSTGGGYLSVTNNVGLAGGYPIQSAYQATAITGLTGLTLDASAGSASLSIGGTVPNQTTVNITAIGYIVYYTGTPPPNPTALQVDPPLIYDQSSFPPHLRVDPSFPNYVIGRRIAQLPVPGAGVGPVYPVYDGASASDCTAGGGTTEVMCWSDGSAWHAYSGGGTSGTFLNEVLTCGTSTTCTLSFTPTTFMSLLVNGLGQVGTGGSPDYTISGTTVTLTTPLTGGDIVYAQYYH